MFGRMSAGPPHTACQALVAASRVETQAAFESSVRSDASRSREHLLSVLMNKASAQLADL